ncbi:hypothetical protein RB195_015682 [Necator americanus]|uniref:Uncharacterized protein n=1 Tax=Necator americanus TaxID=51031 RepID=A0ABR1E5Y6_NECAM
MFPLALATVFAVIFATVDAEHGALQTRHRRQYSYSLYYFCGSYPNQYLSYYPCPCTSCGSSCQHRCSTTMYCQTMDISSSCVNGCCTQNRYPPITSTSMRPTTNLTAIIGKFREAEKQRVNDDDDDDDVMMMMR